MINSQRQPSLGIVTQPVPKDYNGTDFSSRLVHKSPSHMVQSGQLLQAEFQNANATARAPALSKQAPQAPTDQNTEIHKHSTDSAHDFAPGLAAKHSGSIQNQSPSFLPGQLGDVNTLTDDSNQPVLEVLSHERRKVVDEAASKSASIIRQFGLISKKSSNSRQDMMMHMSMNAMQRQWVRRDKESLGDLTARKRIDTLAPMQKTQGINTDFGSEIMSSGLPHGKSSKKTTSIMKKGARTQTKFDITGDQNETNVLSGSKGTVEDMSGSQDVEKFPMSTQIKLKPLEAPPQEQFVNRLSRLGILEGEEADVDDYRLESRHATGMAKQVTFQQTSTTDLRKEQSRFTDESNLSMMQQPVQMKMPVQVLPKSPHRAEWQWEGKKVTFDSLQFYKQYYNSLYEEKIMKDAFVVKQMDVHKVSAKQGVLMSKMQKRLATSESDRQAVFKMDQQPVMYESQISVHNGKDPLHMQMMMKHRAMVRNSHSQDAVKNVAGTHGLNSGPHSVYGNSQRAQSRQKSREFYLPMQVQEVPSPDKDKQAPLTLTDRIHQSNVPPHQRVEVKLVNMNDGFRPNPRHPLPMSQQMHRHQLYTKKIDRVNKEFHQNSAAISEILQKAQSSGQLSVRSANGTPLVKSAERRKIEAEIKEKIMKYQAELSSNTASNHEPTPVNKNKKEPIKVAIIRADATPSEKGYEDIIEKQRQSIQIFNQQMTHVHSGERSNNQSALETKGSLDQYAQEFLQPFLPVKPEDGGVEGRQTAALVQPRAGNHLLIQTSSLSTLKNSNKATAKHKLLGKGPVDEVRAVDRNKLSHSMAPDAEHMTLETERKSKEIEATEQTPLEPPTGKLTGMKLTDAGAYTNEIVSQDKNARSQEEVVLMKSIAEEVNKTFDTEQRRLNAASALQDHKPKEELLPVAQSYTDMHDKVSITKDGVTTEHLSQTYETNAPKSAGGKVRHLSSKVGSRAATKFELDRKQSRQALLDSIIKDDVNESQVDQTTNAAKEPVDKTRIVKDLAKIEITFDEDSSANNCRVKSSHNARRQPLKANAAKRQQPQGKAKLVQEMRAAREKQGSMESAARGETSMERQRDKKHNKKASKSSALMLSGAQMVVGRQQLVQHLKDVIDTNHDTTSFEEKTVMAGSRDATQGPPGSARGTAEILHLVSGTGAKTMSTLGRDQYNQPHQLYIVPTQESRGASRQSAGRESLEVSNQERDMFDRELTETKNHSAERNSTIGYTRSRRSPTARGKPMPAKLHHIEPKIVNRREQPLASSRLMVDDILQGGGSTGDSKEAATTSKEQVAADHNMSQVSVTRLQSFSSAVLNPEGTIPLPLATFKLQQTMQPSQIAQEKEMKPAGPAVQKQQRNNDGTSPMPFVASRKSASQVRKPTREVNNILLNRLRPAASSETDGPTAPEGKVIDMIKQNNAILLSNLRMSKSKDSIPSEFDLLRSASESQAGKDGFDPIRSYEFPVIIQRKQIVKKPQARGHHAPAESQDLQREKVKDARIAVGSASALTEEEDGSERMQTRFGIREQENLKKLVELSSRKRLQIKKLDAQRRMQQKVPYGRVPAINMANFVLDKNTTTSAYYMSQIKGQPVQQGWRHPLDQGRNQKQLLTSQQNSRSLRALAAAGAPIWSKEDAHTNIKTYDFSQLFKIRAMQRRESLEEQARQSKEYLQYAGQLASDAHDPQAFRDIALKIYRASYSQGANRAKDQLVMPPQKDELTEEIINGLDGDFFVEDQQMETINLRRDNEQVSEAPVPTLGAPSGAQSRPAGQVRADNFDLAVSRGILRSGRSTPPTEAAGARTISVRENYDQPSSESPDRVYYVNQTSVNVDDQCQGKDGDTESKQEQSINIQIVSKEELNRSAQRPSIEDQRSEAAMSPAQQAPDHAESQGQNIEEKSTDPAVDFRVRITQKPLKYDMADILSSDGVSSAGGDEQKPKKSARKRAHLQQALFKEENDCILDYANPQAMVINIIASIPERQNNTSRISNTLASMQALQQMSSLSQGSAKNKLTESDANQAVVSAAVQAQTTPSMEVSADEPPQRQQLESRLTQHPHEQRSDGGDMVPMSLDMQAESLARVSLEDHRNANNGSKNRTRMSTILSKKSEDQLYQPGVPRPATDLEIVEKDENLETTQRSGPEKPTGGAQTLVKPQLSKQRPAALQLSQLVLGAKPMALESLGQVEREDVGLIDYSDIKADLNTTQSGKNNRAVMKKLFSNYNSQDDNGGSLSGRQALLEPNQRSKITVLSKQQEEIELRKHMYHWQPPSLAAGPVRPEVFASSSTSSRHKYDKNDYRDGGGTPDLMTTGKVAIASQQAHIAKIIDLNKQTRKMIIHSGPSRNFTVAKYQTEMARRPGDLQITMPEMGGPERSYRPVNQTQQAYMHLQTTGTKSLATGATVSQNASSRSTRQYASSTHPQFFMVTGLQKMSRDDVSMAERQQPVRISRNLPDYSKPRDEVAGRLMQVQSQGTLKRPRVIGILSPNYNDLDETARVDHDSEESATGGAMLPRTSKATPGATSYPQKRTVARRMPSKTIINEDAYFECGVQAEKSELPAMASDSASGSVSAIKDPVVADKSQRAADCVELPSHGALSRKDPRGSIDSIVQGDFHTR